jgi:hypothetical protein
MPGGSGCFCHQDGWGRRKKGEMVPGLWASERRGFSNQYCGAFGRGSAMSNAEANQMLLEVSSKLGEHFDSVQILASWNEEAITACSFVGCGNWYARQGMAKEFLEQDQAQLIGREVSRALPPPPEPAA